MIADDERVRAVTSRGGDVFARGRRPGLFGRLVDATTTAFSSLPILSASAGRSITAWDALESGGAAGTALPAVSLFSSNGDAVTPVGAIELGTASLLAPESPALDSEWLPATDDAFPCSFSDLLLGALTLGLATLTSTFATPDASALVAADLASLLLTGDESVTSTGAPTDTTDSVPAPSKLG